MIRVISDRDTLSLRAPGGPGLAGLGSESTIDVEAVHLEPCQTRYRITNENREAAPRSRPRGVFRTRTHTRASSLMETTRSQSLSKMMR